MQLSEIGGAGLIDLAGLSFLTLISALVSIRHRVFSFGPGNTCMISAGLWAVLWRLGFAFGMTF